MFQKGLFIDEPKVNLDTRRKMIEYYNWQPVSKVQYTSWARSNSTISGNIITMKPTGLNWNSTITLNQCNFQWKDVKNGLFHFSCDYSISGINGTDARLVIPPGLFTAQNPTGGTTRSSWDEVTGFRQDGSGHIDKIAPIQMRWGDTPNDDYYYGMRIYAYTGANSIVTLSNIVFEVCI